LSARAFSPSERTDFVEARLRDKTKTWLEGAAFAVGIPLPIPALIGLLVFDSTFLLWIYVAVVLVAYIAKLLSDRDSLTKLQRKKPG
jgi:hypothetical protein